MKKYLPFLFLISCDSSTIDATLCRMDPDKGIAECSKSQSGISYDIKIENMKCSKNYEGKNTDCWYSIPEDTLKKIADKLQECSNNENNKSD